MSQVTFNFQVVSDWYDINSLFTEISKQQVSEAQTLFNREAQLVDYQQKDLHQKKEASRERTQAALAGRQKVNEMTKKFMKTE